jgi:LPS export ABC transporter protein LptC
MLVGGFVGFWGCQRSPAPASLAGAAPPKVASQVLENFELQDIRGGVKTMSLKSKEARLFESEQTAEVQNPFLVFYQSGRISSEMRAPAGKVQMLTHEVEAWGGVTIVTPDSTTLTTDRLRYDPRKRLVWSDDKVRLEKPDSITEGEGLRTDPELKRVRIGRQRVRLKKAL